MLFQFKRLRQRVGEQAPRAFQKRARRPACRVSRRAKRPRRARVPAVEALAGSRQGGHGLRAVPDHGACRTPLADRPERRPLTEADAFHRQVCRSTADLFNLSPGFETAEIRDCALGLSGEPVADLNLVLLGGAAPAARSFLRQSLERARVRELQILAAVIPSLSEDLAPVAEDYGAAFVGHVPLMALTDPPGGAPPRAALEVRPALDAQTSRDAFALISAAFALPLESITRSMGAGIERDPMVVTYVGYVDGAPMTSATLSQRGANVGVWSMATPDAHQGKGYGRALLRGLIEARRAGGAEAFFLMATAAGLPLYQSLGFRTLFDYAVFATGATTQVHEDAGARG